MGQIRNLPQDLAAMRIAAVLNRSSGSCDAHCADKMAAILGAAKLTLAHMALVEGAQVVAALDKAVAQEADLLIVLGGDGTIRTAAERCAGTQTRLIPLPGGTMNMLPKALYGDAGWDEILAQVLRAPAVMNVSGGEVEGHRFFCAAIFGSPALWAEAREAVRANRWLDALQGALRAYRKTFTRKIRYAIGETSGEAIAVSAICPLVSAALDSRAPALDFAALEPEDLGDAFHLAWTALFSQWRRDTHVTSLRAAQMTIGANGPISAILDGESVRLAPKAQVQYVDRCFEALVPAETSHA